MHTLIKRRYVLQTKRIFVVNKPVNENDEEETLVMTVLYSYVWITFLYGLFVHSQDFFCVFFLYIQINLAVWANIVYRPLYI